jgi:hypothetical protein
VKSTKLISIEELRSFYCDKSLPLPDRVISRALSNQNIFSKKNSFREIHIWEFKNIYALLELTIWKKISVHLKGTNLDQLTNQTKIKKRVLQEMLHKPNYATHISNLLYLGQLLGLSPNEIEKSIVAVRFSRNGPLEYIKFPFEIDIYAWRMLCHTAGDGTVKYHRTTRALPEIQWAQKIENQSFMLKLLRRWNPLITNNGMSIKFPKVLTYAILGSLQVLTFNDLRSEKFAQFVLDLPLSFCDWKVQFLTAFLLDDGSVEKMVNFSQMNNRKLELIMKLCKQLGYPHSSYPPKKQSNGIFTFRLRALGVQNFYKDLKKMIQNDPLLGLWHKQQRIESRISSYSKKYTDAYIISEKVYITILKILGRYRSCTNRQLMKHPLLKPLVNGKTIAWFRSKTWKLNKFGLIQEAKESKSRKHWGLASGKTLDELLHEFSMKYHSK